MLADGRGLLVPFADSKAMSVATLRLLTDASLLAETRRLAYQYAKPMFWPAVGHKYLHLFTEVADEHHLKSVPSISLTSPLSDKNRQEDLLQKEN